MDNIKEWTSNSGQIRQKNYIIWLYNMNYLQKTHYKNEIYKKSILDINEELNNKAYIKARGNNSDKLYFSDDEKYIAWLLWKLIIPENEIMQKWHLVNWNQWYYINNQILKWNIKINWFKERNIAKRILNNLNILKLKNY